MSDHDNDLFDTCCADVADTRFDYRLAAEGKQGLELAHAARTAGGKDYGSDITPALKLTTRNKSTNAPQILVSFVPLWLSCAQRIKCTDGVLPRHLLAPLIDEVCVIQRARFDVRGFSRGINLVVVQRLSDQSLRCFVHLNRRRRDSPKNDLSVRNREYGRLARKNRLISFVIPHKHRHSQHRKIK